jgi:very-short-patch-repair endonuclease
LLDLSARNRLLNMPRHSRTAQTIEVVDEKSTEVYRLLVREGKALTFLPGREREAKQTEGESDEILALALPDDESKDERGVLSRHADTKLQTRLTGAGLQKRLLNLYQDAQTLEDEQGVNILFLALGTMQWIDPHSKDTPRFAPLVLIPVSLDRASAKERFRLRWRQEDCSSNLSLEAFLDRIHLVKLPSFAAGDEFDYDAYVAEVADAISLKEGWSVQPDDIVLGFFSYAKFLMYRDLDPANWPANSQITESPLIRMLLEEGFAQDAERASEDDHLDATIHPADMRHVHDSDSSQVLAAHEAKRGANLVVQGPPGTGKSQTIANIIAEAVADGKTVLFVSEKMAALDVVKRRLDRAGVGDACLELHSNKANRRVLLAELRRTWELGAPKGPAADVADAGLIRMRRLLNEHTFRMHQRAPKNGLTAYETIGHLSRMQRSGGPARQLYVPEADQWNAEDRRERYRVAQDVARWLEREGNPADHPWWGVGIDSVLPSEAERISQTAKDLSANLGKIDGLLGDLARDLGVRIPEKMREFTSVSVQAERAGTAPPGLGTALGSPAWGRMAEVSDLLECGRRFDEVDRSLQGRVSPGGWRMKTEDTRAVLASLPGQAAAESLARVERLDGLIPQLLAAASEVRAAVGMAGDCANCAEVRHTLEVARHVASAPATAPETFTAAIWDQGVERARDLVTELAELEAAVEGSREWLSDAVWDADCEGLRQTLAAHGTGPLRWLSPSWRRADRTLKSLLRKPAMPLPDRLALLDRVARGKKARKSIQEADGFGAAAFGAQWRGERSGTAPLRAIVEWIRALGPRSREIRDLAARTPDSARVRVAVSCLEAIWTEFEPLLQAVLPVLGHAFSGNTEQSPLENLKSRASEIVAADRASRAALVHAPDLVSECVELLSKLDNWRGRERRLADDDNLGRQCFGGLWKGAYSAWPALAQAADWVAQNGEFRHVAAKFERPEELTARSRRITESIEEVLSGVDRLCQDLALDKTRAFGAEDLRDIRIADLRTRLDLWASRPEDLSQWTSYTGRVRQARRLGIGALVDGLESGGLRPENAVAELERACYMAVLQTMARSAPEFTRFDGEVHQGHVEEFVRLEEEHREAARVGAMRAHHQRLPRGGAGPVGLLKAEIARKRGHMPIRQLMSHAGQAIQALKPALMMSPLSVAQFLTPGDLKFDLLVMDEASQIQPVDALGAIARCRQAVVVGDERQLPPTKFFARMTGSQAEDEDSETAQVADVESILGLFLARGAPQRTLRWHYRSEHHSLIAVSNREFYDNKLCILPSPYTSAAGRGVLFHLVSDGVYDSGNSRTNIIEAKRVAKAVIEHARLHPRQTLGVGTFSAAQRRAILDQLELLRRTDPETESFFTDHSNEPFFVKNLENIQGDERDVIFISVGYARNAAGQMNMRFGPLGNQGGERRLNVLITRARRRCEVFSSITDQDIDSERASGGVAALQLFMRFARTGRMDEAPSARSDEIGQALEEDIAAALGERGYEVDTHVGISGAFVDLAVLNPERPGRYLIGIECDGASYASARSARDRDRLRREALERQGWRLHRVWSMDWYQRPAEQLRRITAAIEEEKVRLAAEAEDEEDRVPEHTMEREEQGDMLAEVPVDTVAYVESAPAQPIAGCDLLGTPTATLAVMVADIVSIEGPIHQDEVVARVRGAWGLQRAGARIQEHLSKAIRIARATRGVEREGKFLYIAGRKVQVRNRKNVASRSLRLPEMLPPAEIRAGILDVIRENFGAREEEIISTVLRRLGYATSGATLREAVETRIRKMRANGEIQEQGELLTLVDVAKQA